MYNILGQLKSEQKELEEGYVVSISHIYEPEEMSDNFRLLRFLIDLGKHSLLLKKTVVNKDITAAYYKEVTIINRKDASSYLNSAYDTKSDLFITLLINELKNMGIILDYEAKYGIEAIIKRKFLSIAPRLAHFKNKKYNK